MLVFDEKKKFSSYLSVWSELSIDRNDLWKEKIEKTLSETQWKSD